MFKKFLLIKKKMNKQTCVFFTPHTSSFSAIPKWNVICSGLGHPEPAEDASLHGTPNLVPFNLTSIIQTLHN
jgi:hypothetical protein